MISQHSAHLVREDILKGLVYHPENFYTYFLSLSAKERSPGPIRKVLPLENRPNVISLLAGKPNPDTFPITSISFTSRSPADPTTEVSHNIVGESLSTALQYTATSGIPVFVDWMTGLQVYFHRRMRSEEWQVDIGAGSQDLLYKAFHTLIDHGDPVLVEAPLYAAVIPIFRSLHCDIIEVETDGDGISSTSLHRILESWPTGKRAPRVLYTVPCGCNPTGVTTTRERRLEVLEIARAHKLLILEDDPYYFLYFGSRPRPPSYFALEAQDGGPVGIVLRFDSLSTVIGGGLRIGTVSGPVPIIRAIDMYTSSSNLQMSSLTQIIAHSLLSSWGYDGFLKHTQNLSALYRAKRDIFQVAMERHLDALAEWVAPEAGMFFWFKLRLPPSPDAPHGDSEILIRTKALENGVLAMPGTAFLPNGTKTAYVRASFSLLNEEQANEALKRLAHVIRQAQTESADALMH